MSVTISVRADFKALQKQLHDLAAKQIPFAEAQAVTALAKRVAAAETEAISETFANPRAFTKKSVGVRPARKGYPVALVYMKDITAAYLKPYEDGGAHKLPGRALLNPKDIRLDANGQLPRGTMAALRARPDIFIGVIKTANGEAINGVWQRVTNTKKVSLLNGKGKKLRGLNRAAKDDPGHLKLLIRFGDALPVKEHLGWKERAARIIKEHGTAELRRACEAAMASAR